MKIIENRWKRSPRGPSLLLEKSFGRRALLNVCLRCLRQYVPAVSDIMSLEKITGLKVDNDIDEQGKQSERQPPRRSYGVALCFTARSCGEDLVRGGGGNSKETIFRRNNRKAESTVGGNCCIVH
ncbi:hypothetical protein AVEN_28816-1 [Araneus ventricosus]|uniref:Uncharacterized protein n=1 Tax=Araneus ventricosus TaxID=182803 RepID=A0A4Y2PL44_ARAVE|nr:hypothetical protein AVEN_28816-1 [Araneus ventricosus]